MWPGQKIFRRFSPFALLERIKRQKTERRTVINNNETKKNNEALADEALDQVAGGVRERLTWQWESSSPRVLTCGICHKSDASVAVYTIDLGKGWTSMMYLCPNCLADERKKYKVTEGWGGK